jgi:hypothetical protein
MKGTNLFMKKFVLCLLAALAVLTLAIGASAAVANNAGNVVHDGGLVGGAENIVGGVVRGAENVAGGVVRGAGDVVQGVGDAFTGNKDGVHHNNAVVNEHNRAINNNAPITTTIRANERDRNPSTGIGLGIFEIAAIGTTMLGTAALAGRKRK